MWERVSDEDHEQTCDCQTFFPIFKFLDCSDLGWLWFFFSFFVFSSVVQQYLNLQRTYSCNLGDYIHPWYAQHTGTKVWFVFSSWIRENNLQFEVTSPCWQWYFVNLFRLTRESPLSSAGSVHVLWTGYRWFDPWLGQYSFRLLTIVIATGFIPFSLKSVVSTMVVWGSLIVWCLTPFSTLFQLHGGDYPFLYFFLSVLRTIFFPSHWLISESFLLELKAWEND